MDDERNRCLRWPTIEAVRTLLHRPGLRDDPLVPHGSDTGFQRLARACPHCGAREPTLGSQCPICGKSYEPQSWADRVSGFGGDWPATGGVSEVVGGLLAAVLTLLSLLA